MDDSCNRPENITKREIVLRRPKRRWKDNIDVGVKKKVGRDLSALGWRSAVGFCSYGDDTSGFITALAFVLRKLNFCVHVFNALISTAYYKRDEKLMSCSGICFHFRQISFK